MIKILLNLVFFVCVSIAHSLPLFEGTGEREDWLGTYYQGKKMGFTKSKTRWGPDGVVMDSMVFFKISYVAADQSTTIKQTTRLSPDFKLSSFSLIQEISGHRQQVEGNLKVTNLVSVPNPWVTTKKKRWSSPLKPLPLLLFSSIWFLGD